MGIKTFILFFITVLLGIGINTFSQDVITLRNGDELKAVVNEIGIDVIKYKKFENINGPIYTMEKSKIFMIKYENGTKDVFKEQTIEKKSAVPEQKNIQVIVSNTPKNETVTDIDGNIYNTVTIGSQVWMVENLRTLHYRNGDAIPQVTDNWSSQKSGALCYYNNDSQDVVTYGCIYNWYVAADSRKVAPEGWAIPSEADWNTLVNYLGGEGVAGGKMKEAGTLHWSGPNKGASNQSGFTALPAGGRYDNGKFGLKGLFGLWMTSPEDNPNQVWYRTLDWNSSQIANHHDGSKGGGGSIRCIKKP